MWKMINYELRGRGHIKANTPCQDKTITSKSNNAYVIALADGAGSASHSHYGAQVVVSTISKLLTDKFDQLITETNGVRVKEEILLGISQELQAEAINQGCAIKDLASTLLAVALKDDKFIIVHVGDGIVGVVKDDVLKVASQPENGEYSNSTTFVTSSNAIQSMRLFKGQIGHISGFVLMSDGSCESFYHKKSDMLSVGAKKIMDWSILLPEEKMHDLLAESFQEIVHQNTLDDCSIAILVNTEKSNLLYNSLDFLGKCNLFDINPKDKKAATKRLMKYENMVNLLQGQPLSISVLARKCRMKKKYAKLEVRKLVGLGIIKPCEKTQKLMISLHL